jgi:hypothetical protein
MAKKIETETTIDKVLELLDKYIDTTGTILESYETDIILGDGLTTELGQADANLRSDIENLNEEDTFKTLIKKLGELDEKDIEADELLDLLDADAIRDYLADGDGCAIIKINNESDRRKLEEFLHTELYPYLSDQQANIITL